MATAAKNFDVVVVGGSVAGSSAARLFAQRGASVALVERNPDPAAYKVICTHAILPPATPMIERLGLAPLLAERGVPRTWAQLWTPHGGWFSVPDSRGWGVTRRTLDPLLRGLAASTPGVEFLPGYTARRILHDRGRPAGIEVEDREGSSVQLGARLLVAADGRKSSVARLAGVPGRVRPHNRFFYFSYWRGMEVAKSPAGPSIRLWFPNPDGASEFPNENGLTVLGAIYPRRRLPEVRADLERSYMRTLTELPDAPDLSKAERVSKILGKIDVPNVMRPAARPGIAFVGDAALAADPTFGVGISFAFMGAEWLVDETSGSLDSRGDLDDALRRYRRKFAWRLLPHYLQMADFSTGREVTPLERRAFRRAAVDPVFARAFGNVLARERSVFHLMNPRISSRLLIPDPHPSEAA
ncbi:MAG TPA: FAD-dependent oxidoreductase [Solirubrobacterales bacterium]|nr:FAD-dependent oxidoreductase [Solirubrobacterales bacterium]